MVKKLSRDYVIEGNILKEGTEMEVIKEYNFDSNKSTIGDESTEEKGQKIKEGEFKITFEDGNTIYTRMNSTLKDAEKYYVGNYFNFGVEGDKMVKAIKVEQIDESTEKKDKKIEEASTMYGDDDIDLIEQYLGYEEAIDSWAKGISIDDGIPYIETLCREYDIDIDDIRDKNDLFDVIDDLKYIIGEEQLFKELYYYLSKDVAEYLIIGIVRDWDLRNVESFVKNSKSVE